MAFCRQFGCFLENLGEYAFLLNERKNRSDQVQWQANPRMAGRWRSCAPDMRCEKLRSENWDLRMKQHSPWFGTLTRSLGFFPLNTFIYLL
jgi:hypothetical protein